MVVAITGADGFVGGNMARYLEQKHQQVKRITRSHSGDYAGKLRLDWMEGANTLIHCAATAHAGHKLTDTQVARIQRINSDVPVELLLAAAERGIGRFVFISSAHVYGRSATGLLDEDADLLPTNIYGATKMDAENRLVSAAEKCGMDLIILRPPLIYGPGVKANFLRLMKLVGSGLPLPFSALKEQRSYLYVDNLSDAVFQLLRTELPCWNDVYNIADSTPLALPQLCKLMSNELDRNNVNLYIPKWTIKALLELSGRRHMIEALCKPLVLDTRAIEHTLSWKPPLTTQQGVAATAQWLKRGTQ